MTSPTEAAELSQSANYDALLSALPQLLRDLRKQGYKAGIDQMLSAQILFAIWSAQPTKQQAVINASLGAVFCGSRDEQQRFSDIFDLWYAQASGADTVSKQKIPHLSQPPRWSATFKSNWRLRLAIVVCLCALVLGLFWPERPLKIDATELVQQTTLAKEAPIRPSAGRQTFIAAPRLPPAPVQAPALYYPDWSKHIKYLPWLPLLLWGGWLAWRLQQRYLALKQRRRQTQEILKLEALSLADNSVPLFPAAALKMIYSAWRRAIPFRSQRLHEADTVQCTLQQHGYFQPAYRQRLLPSEYILLIDRRHYEDYAARMGFEFQQRMLHEGLFVTTYQYDNDPRYCWPLTAAAHCYSLATLAERHHGKHLLIVGLAGSFFSLPDYRPIDCGAEDTWRSKTLFSVNTPYEWRLPEQRMLEQGFQLLPFTRCGLRQSSTAQPVKNTLQHLADARTLDYRDAALPPALNADAYDWLEDRWPARQRRRQTLPALKGYLGREGFLLLAAIAAYPALSWSLTLALDFQLGLSGDEEREIRLRKLARLPWLRQGRIPDHWRRFLLRDLPRSALETINDTYQALLDNAGKGSLHLPVAVPDWQAAKKQQRERLDTASAGDPLHDTVFASIIRGRKPRLLEFTLPQRFAQWVPPQYWRGWLGPALGFLLLTGIAAWGITIGWHGFLGPLAVTEAQQDMQNELRKYTVRIDYQAEAMRGHAEVLQNVLRQWGFQAQIGDLLLEQPQSTAQTVAILKAKEIARVRALARGEAIDPKPKESGNRIKYALQKDRPIADLAAKQLRYLSYGADVIHVENPEMPVQEITIQLRRVSHPGAVYRDFIQPQLIVETRRDRLASGALGPVMVKIPAGCFEMGFAKTESEFDGASLPQHRVCIGQDFFLGRYEVTFNEYLQFAQDTQHDIPGDKGWGQGSRPVINVTWNDATAYAQWLSQKTGKKYRLPSEAEWEYAARAGSVTPYWWGIDVQSGWANCAGCGSRWGGKKTAPVGTFPANHFGLYDSAGNVWEWVQDCWHDNYQDAPKDGRVWESANDGDCGRRVVRGGSWYSEPWTVRSAFRYWFPPGGRFSFLGFRLAQDP